MASSFVRTKANATRLRMKNWSMPQKFMRGAAKARGEEERRERGEREKSK
jgi:hypothetical protein